VKTIDIAARLRCGVAPVILAAAMLSPSIAYAQDDTPQESQDAGYNEQVIVVTGSILRQTDTQGVSPVTMVTTDALDARGISTVQEGLQTLAANNGPALTNSFTANGAFAGGASAISLRGLSTNSTLVLFDGLRAAYYPLADDGSRNFVDLNTIPDDIIERVEVLRDGASSSYGADAIAGVVNIITKRQFKGFTARAETGLSSRGDASSYRLSATAGMGDIDRDGYNAYISGFYYKSAQLNNRDRGYPYNSDDLRGICYDGQCGGNGVLNGLDGDGVLSSLSTGANFMVRPVDPDSGEAIGSYQNLGTNCGVGTTHTTTAADLEKAPLAPSTLCQYDVSNLYGVIQPKMERFGLSARFTGRVNDSTEAYAEFNFMQSTVGYTDVPASIYANAPAGLYYPQYSTKSSGGAYAPGSGALTLPVWVCSEGVNCDTAVDGKLNPNNPFAAQGQEALLVGRNMSKPTYRETRSRAYRVAFGINGDITDGWHFDIGATAMHNDLRRKASGFVYIQHLLDVIADGSYNFVDPTQNSAAIQDYLTPTAISNASSDQYQIQATISTELMDLPGGPLQLGFGGSIRYEAIDAPSFNTDINGPTERYFTLNAFGTKGHRYVYSSFAELNAPVLDSLTLSASGRYDNYSSGQDYFSPKFGVKYRPIQSLLLRGTWSRGFRIPSFGEANALPTTGYVNNSSKIFTDSYLAQYGCSVENFTACPAYIRNGSYGITTLATPDLKPEKSRSFTLGAFFEPVRNVSFSVDYYNIKKTGVITTAPSSPALLAYYAGQDIPEGYNVIVDAADPSYADATPRVNRVETSLVNANTQKVQGLDFAINGAYTFANGMKFSSTLDASYIIKLETVFPDGTVERYDGTLGNFNLTAGTGTPKWHGTWVNTLSVSKVDVTGTVNYFGGYDLSAMDQGNGYKDCGLSDSTTPCHVKSYVTFDLNLKAKVDDKFTIYATMLNVFDRMPPVDVITYGALHYNPVQGGTGILGRYFKVGAKVDF